jgi:hypothetical protein
LASGVVAAGRELASVGSVHDYFVCSLSGFHPSWPGERALAEIRRSPGVGWRNPVARLCRRARQAGPAGRRARALGKLVVIPGVGVLVKGIDGGLLEVVCCLAGRVGLTGRGRPGRLVGVGQAEVGELGQPVVVGREAGRGDLAVA